MCEWLVVSAAVIVWLLLCWGCNPPPVWYMLFLAAQPQNSGNSIHFLMDTLWVWNLPQLCNSTPIKLASVAHFWVVLPRTLPLDQAAQSSTQCKLQPFCCLCIKICCDNSVDNLLHIYLSRFLAAPQPAPLHPCTPGPLHPVPCGTAFALCCVHSRLNIRCV